MIFINYRRDESMGMAGRLHDRLAQSFGRKNLFMDVDHIPPGVDFVTHLNNQVAACKFFIAVIGPNWLNVRNEMGERRLDDPDDFVTIEIEAALARDIRVIPVLVDGARMPKVEELPKSLKPLVRRQAIELRHAHFGRDAEALIEKIREAFSDKPLRLGRWRAAAAVLGALILLGWVGLFTTGIPISVVQPGMRGQTEKERLAATKAEEERQAKAAAEVEARAKAEQEEKERLAAAKAEEERKAKAAAEAEARAKAEQAEKERLAAAKAEEERKAKAAAEAEARRKSESEQQRLAALRARHSALLSQSHTEISNGDYDRAIATASEVMRLDPKSALAFISRGVAYERKGDMDRAIADYSEAIRLDPNNALASSNRGIAYAKKGDNDRAIADYNEAIRLDPKNANAFGGRGLAYMRKGDNDRAITDYNEAIRLNPKDALAFANRGIAYANKGDNDRALADNNEAIRLNPNDANAFGNRGVIYARKGDNNRALADYNEAIRLDPKGAINLCNRGRLKLHLKDPSGNADVAKARQLGACR